MDKSSVNKADIFFDTYKNLRMKDLGDPIAIGEDSRVYRLDKFALKIYDTNTGFDYPYQDYPLITLDDLDWYKKKTEETKRYLEKYPSQGEMRFFDPKTGEYKLFYYEFLINEMLWTGSFDGNLAALADYVKGPNIASLFGIQRYLADSELTDFENNFFEENHKVMMKDFRKSVRTFPDPPDDSSGTAFYLWYEIRSLSSRLNISCNAGFLQIGLPNVKFVLDYKNKKVFFVITDLYNNFRAR